MVTLSPDDHARVSAAIASARDRTRVDVRLVAVPSSSQYGAFALVYSLLAAVIAGCVSCLAFPRLPGQFLVALEAVIALAALACLQSGRVRRALVPKASLRKAARRQARLAYADLQLRSRHDRPAVLLFCSRAERHAEILADERVLEHVPEAVWQRILSGFMPHMAKGDPASGFVHLVETSAAALEAKFPSN